MKFALVLNDDPLILVEPLNRILLQAATKLDCVIVVPGITNSALKKKYMRTVLKIFGLNYVLRILWRFVFAPFWSFSRLARYHKMAFFTHSSVNSPAFRALLKQRGVTHVLSVTAEIYKVETLAMPEVLFYNFHGSILPAHKGLLPIFWAALSGVPQGVTLHQISERIDEGNIIFQQRLVGARDCSMPAVTDVLIEDFPQHILRAIDHLERDLPPVLLNEGLEPSYDPIPTDTDVKKYFKRLRMARSTTVD